VKPLAIYRLRLIASLVSVAAVWLLGCSWLSEQAHAASGDVNRPECPFAEASPGFRNTLPDCRAYELVSPAYGAGAIASGARNREPSISPNGEHLLAVSFGPFAETEDMSQVAEEYGAYYEFSRTSSGWVAESQDPPASLYPWYILEDQSATNLGLSLWLVPGALAPGEEPERVWFRKNSSQYLLREGAHRFTAVGPTVAPDHEAGAEPKFSFIRGLSDDATHIAFSVLARLKQLWPGDTTTEATAESRIERLSLYEYHGIQGGEPVLVGVRNEGVAPWQPGATHLNEGAELISDCGTEYNGMSASGERVFFTALAAEQEVGGHMYCEEHEGVGAGSGPTVNELYARVGGSKTIKISGAGDAVYQGASEEGSKVFFSEAGNLYEYDFTTAQITAIASNVTGVPGVALDGSHIYLTSTHALPTEANANGETAQHAAEEGATSFLYVYNTESQAHSLAFVSRGEGTQSFDTSRDGQFLVFSSPKKLMGTGDTSPETVPQLFEYDASTATVRRVSVGQKSSAGFVCPASGKVESGYDCDGNTTLEEDTSKLVEGAVNSVAANGTVVFTSELPLTPGSVQGRHFYNGVGALQVTGENVYEFRAGQVYLISPDDEPLPANYQSLMQTRLFGIDESGKDIFFSTVDQLVPQDTDTQSSWYDAREEGGLPAPPVQPECAGEACQGAVSSEPSTSSPLAPPVADENVFGSTAAVTAAKPKTSAQIRAKKLAKALKACKAKHGRQKRIACERNARTTYALDKQAKKAASHLGGSSR
jgi:hypothetical protein